MRPTPTDPADLSDAPCFETADGMAAVGRAYARDGYVRLRQVLPATLLTAQHQAISDLVHRRAAGAAAVPMSQRGTYQQAFMQVMNLWRDSAVVRELVFHPLLARIAATLMQVRAVRLYHDQALFKEPGGGHTPWHCDQQYWPLDSDRTCTVWIPLVPVTAGMGPLAFAAGSHRLVQGRDLAIGDESERTLGRTLRDHRLDEQPYDLGDVSFHSGWCFHRAGPNSSDRMRAVMTVIYMADGIRLTPPVRQQQHEIDAWMPGAQVGQPVATALNPLLWPMADTRADHG